MLLFLAPQAFGGVHRRAFVHLGGEAVAGEGGERRLMQVFAHLDEVHFPVDAAVPAVVSGVDPDAAAEGAQQFPAVVPGLAGMPSAASAALTPSQAARSCLRKTGVLFANRREKNRPNIAARLTRAAAAGNST